MQQQYTALPELDPRILATVADVVARRAATPYEKVRNIHAFLTDRANGFRYSLSTAPGTSGNDLVDFLTLRRGLLRAVRRHDGGDGAGGRACRPGSPSATRRVRCRTTAAG